MLEKTLNFRVFQANVVVICEYASFKSTIVIIFRSNKMCGIEENDFLIHVRPLSHNKTENFII